MAGRFGQRRSVRRDQDHPTVREEFADRVGELLRERFRRLTAAI